MNDFSYYNIFETKGIEYIITIVFFAILIPFWIVLNKPLKINHQTQRVFGGLSANNLKIPMGLFYSKNHTWTHMEKSGAVTVGINDLLQHITGKVKFNMLKDPGEIIIKGDLLTIIDQNGKQLKIFAPVSGKILKTNYSLEENPETLNTDPYEKGWIYALEPSNWMKETKSCYLAEDATNWAVKELERFKDFLSVSTKKLSPEFSMVTMQDGGELRVHALAELPDEIWKDFQKEFLD